MVTYTGSSNWDIRGLSSEREAFTAKHVIPNGSTYYEIDTGTVYMLDAENHEWIEQ